MANKKKDDEIDWAHYVPDYLIDDDDDIPEGCAVCGGPYPDCMTSCNLFDD